VLTDAAGGDVSLSVLLKLTGLATSKREAKRQLAEGSVRIDGTVVEEDVDRPINGWWGTTLQVGKRKWVRIAKPA
jgi:tyrosyl-tRNA synthetase